MIIKVGDTNKRDHAKANYIRVLLKRGVIKQYIVDGYVGYDTEELLKYQMSAKRGRPIKIKGE